MKLANSALQEWMGPFANDVGIAYNTFTTKKDVSPLPIPRIPAGRLELGTIIKIEAEGEYSCATGVVATPGLHTSLSYDGAVGSVPAIDHDIALASAITTGTNPAAWPWRMEWRGKVTKLGTAGSMKGNGTLEFGTSLIAYLAANQVLPITAALRTVAINTFVDNNIGVSWTWGASAAGNTVTTYQITCVLS